MISCFANITAELIRVKDGIAVGYMTASGSSVHLDTITGGKEALLVAADDLSKQVMSLLEKEEENKMKKTAFLACAMIACVAIAGCASLEPTAVVDNNAGVQPLPPYTGPKARVAVADFEVKAAKATGEIGTGLREMLVTALVNSNRFW